MHPMMILKKHLIVNNLVELP